MLGGFRRSLTYYLFGVGRGGENVVLLFRFIRIVVFGDTLDVVDQVGPLGPDLRVAAVEPLAGDRKRLRGPAVEAVLFLGLLLVRRQVRQIPRMRSISLRAAGLILTPGRSARTFIGKALRKAAKPACISALIALASARAGTVSGHKRAPGTISAMYSQIASDSQITAPSGVLRVGTVRAGG